MNLCFCHFAVTGRKKSGDTDLFWPLET